MTRLRIEATAAVLHPKHAFVEAPHEPGVRPACQVCGFRAINPIHRGEPDAVAALSRLSSRWRA